MASQRKLIRHAVVALLAGAGTAAGARVYASRIEPFKSIQLPAFAVYTLTDEVDEDAESGLVETRVIEMDVDGWVAHKDSAPADDAMDDLAEQAENAIIATISTGSMLGGLVTDIALVSTRMQLVAENGLSDPTCGQVTLKYAVTYLRDLTATADDLDDFRTVDAKYDLVGGVVDTAIPEDTFTVQEP